MASQRTTRSTAAGGPAAARASKDWAAPRVRSAPPGTATIQTPIRLLTAVPLCDGHDSAISTINLELVRAGMEVIYLGYNRSVRDIVRAAIQEDVRAIGISSYNGGHVEFFSAVVAELRQRAAGHIGVFGGGGGTITYADATEMHAAGVDAVYFAGTRLDEIVADVKKRYGAARRHGASNIDGDVTLAWALSSADEPSSGCEVEPLEPGPRGSCRVIGIAGPGGVGKTTLIDELVLRALRRWPTGRVAILSHDPSLVSHGALLGDRAAMIHAQDDRVLMRSLATRGRGGGLAPQTARCLDVLRHRPAAGKPFDLILLETVGLGQEALPFTPAMVDRAIMVMSPEYGARLQLQKISMIDQADVIVVNKSDRPGARTARAEVEGRIAMGQHPPKLFQTVATRHRDTGVDALFDALTS